MNNDHVDPLIASILRSITELTPAQSRANKREMEMTQEERDRLYMKRAKRKQPPVSGEKS